MCKTTIIHVDADAFFAQLKAQPTKTEELTAKGYAPEKIKEMEEMNILKALNENRIKP
jgi:broad-specificity NMP kinase